VRRARSRWIPAQPPRSRLAAARAEGGEGGGTGETRFTVAEAAAEELTAAGERIVPSCGRSYRSRRTPSCVRGPRELAKRVCCCACSVRSLILRRSTATESRQV
jgi:hypothetical protein